jgi:hypothetical protein
MSAVALNDWRNRMSDAAEAICRLTIEALEADLSGWTASVVLVGTSATVRLKNKELAAHISSYAGGFVWCVDVDDGPTRDGDARSLDDAIAAVQATQRLRRHAKF